MGFTYRKSIALGPFRINLSKSGVGFSLGAPGVRTGVSAEGKRYTTFNIPGTGIGYKVDSSTPGAGCLKLIILGALPPAFWLLHHFS